MCGTPVVTTVQCQAGKFKFFTSRFFMVQSNDPYVTGRFCQTWDVYACSLLGGILEL